MEEKMSQPLNPNTLLPMSLETDRIHQINEQHPANKQTLTADQLNNRQSKRQNRVNNSSRTEKKSIANNNSGTEQQKKNKDEKNSDSKTGNSKESKRRCSEHRGNYIDVNI